MFGLSFQSDVYGLFFSLGLGRRQCWRKERDSEILLLFNHSVVSDSLATLWTVAHQAPLPLGILQARILKWIAISLSRGSFQPRGRTFISCRFFTTEPPGKPPKCLYCSLKWGERLGYLCQLQQILQQVHAQMMWPLGPGQPVDPHVLLSVFSIRTHGFASSPVLNLVFMLDCSYTFSVHRYLFCWLKKFKKERERNLLIFYSRVPY